MNKMTLPDYLVRRKAESHKGDYGHALLIAGSYGKMGAAVLAAQAALRVGVGLLTVHVPRCGVDILQTAVPEAMTEADSNEHCWCSLPKDVSRYNAVAIGPGLGTDTDTQEALAVLLEVLPPTTTLILDADALNMLAQHTAAWSPLLPHSTILTPHEREFERLICENMHPQMATLSIEQRNKEQELYARQHHTVLLRKGHRTRIVAPDGSIAYNTTGNAGIATAGAGDVLTGILLGLAAQQAAYESTNDSNEQHAFATARLGAYLHGLAGDIAADTIGEASLMASDIVKALPKAIASHKC